MDIFSHALWTGLSSRAVNLKIKKPLSVRMAAFWGIFPDLLAFTPLFFWVVFNLISGSFAWNHIPRPSQMEPFSPDTPLIFRITSVFYNISHSIIIFLLVAAVLLILNRFIFSDSLKFRRPPWEMAGWLFHIIIDIPTHTYEFYPTPFLWPVSGWKFSGFHWDAPWFIALNYSAIIIFFIVLRKKSARNKKVD